MKILTWFFAAAGLALLGYWTVDRVGAWLSRARETCWPDIATPSLARGGAMPSTCGRSMTSATAWFSTALVAPGDVRSLRPTARTA